MNAPDVAQRPDELAHFVSTEPFDPVSATRLTPEQERFYLASQWTLMWWKFKQHRVAVFSGAILLLMYASTLVSEILVPYNLHTRNTNFIYAPPQRVHFIRDGQLTRPFVYAMDKTLDMQTLRRDYREDAARPQPLRFLCSGDPYRFWGLVDLSFHLVCPDPQGTLFLLGSDRLGRDVLSRIVYGARISLTIGLLGITISFALALLFGGLAGYFGGWIDTLVQRMIEVIRSFPELPLWMALSAVLPVT
ncbi:MAG: ABC transporter permease, partial [Betaproteobacteria bacterium]